MITQAARIEVHRVTEAEFGALKGEWNSLLRTSLAESIFLRYEWIHSWWETFGHGKELCILTIRDDHCLIGIAPFYAVSHEPLPGRTLMLCSAEEVYPDYLDIIAKTGREAEVIDAISRFLDDGCFSWQTGLFDNVTQESTLFRLVALWQTRYLVRQRLSSVCPVIKITGSFDDFLKSTFDKKKRYNLKRQVKLALDRLGLRFQQVEEPASIEQAMEQLFTLHDKRAREKGIKSTFSAPQVKSFHQRVSKLFTSEGLLHLSLLLDRDLPVSVLYGYVYNKKFCFYQSGRDPAWEMQSVGTVLLTLVIKHVFDAGLVEFDFLKGGELYKKSWANEGHKEFQVMVYKRDALGFLRYWGEGAKEWVKACAKRSEKV